MISQMSKAKWISILLSSLLLVSFAEAQNKKTQQRKATAKPAVKKAAPAARPAGSLSQRQLSEALGLVRNGQYAQAIPRLYNLSRRADLAKERVQIKYILGVALMEQKLYQIAAFQFVEVIRNGNNKYTQQAIERLSIAADELGEDSLLNYAISKVQLAQFPEKYKDIIYYRLGEIQLKSGRFEEAAQSFARVPSGSRYFAQARFNRGRAQLEAKQPSEALKSFNSLLNSRAQAPVTDPNKVAAGLAIARTYYQAGDFDQAIEWYRKVPRDTEFWHSALFEQSWAYLRAAKFRSVLSNFQSLHSAYYDEFYIPESLLLRAIVYLYICKYTEMDKVLGLFEKSYGSVRNSVGQFVQTNKDPISYYQELEKAMAIRRGAKPSAALKIPYNVARHILEEGDVKRSIGYLMSLNEEKKKLDANGSLNGAFASYAQKIIANRAKNTRLAIGDMAKAHMLNMRTELKDLYEQASFIRYEMINGQKEQLKKRIAGKDIKENQIDDDVNRQFYIQNGYEYWPFDGEYWLDEIGNFHYLGKQSCE